MKRSGLRRQMYRIALAAVCISAPAIGGAFAQDEAMLPGGASSLQETYQDWLVTCVLEGGKRCALSQRTEQNGQQLLAIELTTDADGQAATGALVLPFGLALDAGVTLQVDDGSAGAPLRFSTCLSRGCIVPLDFDAEFLGALRAGETLETISRSLDGDRAISLSVSLKGFSAAFDRVSALME